MAFIHANAKRTAQPGSAPPVKASITGTTLQVEVQDDLSGVAGVQVNSMLFTEQQAGSIIRIALDDTLARYDTLSIRAFDYAGNFSEPVLLNNPCYEDNSRVTAAATNSPKPTKHPNSTAEITIQPTATKRSAPPRRRRPQRSGRTPWRPSYHCLMIRSSRAYRRHIFLLYRPSSSC